MVTLKKFMLCFFLSAHKCLFQEKDNFEIYKQQVINFFQSEIDRYEAHWQLKKQELISLISYIKVQPKGKGIKNDVYMTQNKENKSISIQDIITQDQKAFNNKERILSITNELKKIVYKKNINEKIKHAIIQFAQKRDQLEISKYLPKFEQKLISDLKHLLLCPCDKFCDEFVQYYLSETNVKAALQDNTKKDKESIQKFKLLCSMLEGQQNKCEIFKYIFFHEFLENFKRLLIEYEDEYKNATKKQKEPFIKQKKYIEKLLKDYLQLNKTVKDILTNYLKTKKNNNIAEEDYFDQYLEFLKSLNSVLKYQILSYDLFYTNQNNAVTKVPYKVYYIQRSQLINNFVNELVENYMEKNYESIIKNCDAILFLKHENIFYTNEFKHYTPLIKKIEVIDTIQNINNQIVKNVKCPIKELPNHFDNQRKKNNTKSKQIKIVSASFIILSVCTIFYYYKLKK